MIHCDRFGNLILSMPRGRAAGHPYPQYSIHRGALQMLLKNAVVNRLGPDVLQLGMTFQQFRQSSDSVHLVLEERATGTLVSREARALIGADGLHSVVRAQLHPNEPALRWSGIQMWRGATRAAEFLSGASMVVAGSNRASKFVAYPICKKTRDKGEALINWVAEGRIEEASERPPESWSRTCELEDVLPRFKRWSFGWLDPASLIRDAPILYEYPMVDRDPLSTWGTGRVTLLGDAAHPMYPVGSNGGSQAILDAREISEALARTSDPIQGFSEYEATRRPLTTKLVLASRRMGPERTLRLVEERAPNGFENIEDVLQPHELDALGQSYSGLVGRR